MPENEIIPNYSAQRTAIEKNSGYDYFLSIFPLLSVISEKSVIRMAISVPFEKVFKVIHLIQNTEKCVITDYKNDPIAIENPIPIELLRKISLYYPTLTTMHYNYHYTDVYYGVKVNRFFSIFPDKTFICSMMPDFNEKYPENENIYGSIVYRFERGKFYYHAMAKNSYDYAYVKPRDIGIFSKNILQYEIKNQNTAKSLTSEIEYAKAMNFNFKRVKDKKPIIDLDKYSTVEI